MRISLHTQRVVSPKKGISKPRSYDSAETVTIPPIWNIFLKSQRRFRLPKTHER